MRLNLGSGNAIEMKKIGFTNVDIEKFHAVDVVSDIEKTLPFGDETIDDIHCSHALEHCSMASVPTMLKDWYRILKKDGKIYLVVPEIEGCMKNFLETSETDSSKWGWKIEYILGAQINQAGQQFHKSAYTPVMIRKLIESVGFKVDKLEIINNGKNDCIHLNAHK